MGSEVRGLGTEGPGLPGPGTAIAEVPSTATAIEQQIWRGIHEGAHLDHLSSVARLRHPLGHPPGRPLAPSLGRISSMPAIRRKPLASSPAHIFQKLRVASISPCRVFSASSTGAP